MATEVIPCQILEASLEIALKLLAHPSHFAGEPEVVLVHGEQEFRELYRREGKVSLPVLAAQLDSGSKNRNSYHGKTFKRQGITGAFSTEKKVYYKWHLKPVSINYTIRYLTNDYQDALNFMKSWLFKDELLNFDLNYDELDFKVGIHVEINDDIQINPMEIDQRGEIFRVDTSLIMHTYVGEIRSIPQVQETSKVTLVIPFQNDQFVTVANVTGSNRDE